MPPAISSLPLRQLVDEIEQRNWERAAERIESGENVLSTQPDGMTPLHWAVFHGHADTVKRLLDAKADVNAVTEYEVTPLSIACQNGDAAITPLLLEAGADVNATLPGDVTPLMSAARTGNADVVVHSSHMGPTSMRPSGMDKPR